MSTEAIFEFKSDKSIEEIRSKVGNIWISSEQYTIEIMPNSRDGFMICALEYLWGEVGEDKRIRAVIKYLIAISLDQRVYYYPSMDGYSIAPDFMRPIAIDEIFSEEFKPGDRNNIPYRYLILAD
jgi:hypothetical protein